MIIPSHKNTLGLELMSYIPVSLLQTAMCRVIHQISPSWISGCADCVKKYRVDNLLLLKKKKKKDKSNTCAPFSIVFTNHWYNSQEKTSHATRNAEQFVMALREKKKALCTSNPIYLSSYKERLITVNWDEGRAYRSKTREQEVVIWRSQNLNHLLHVANEIMED